MACFIGFSEDHAYAKILFEGEGQQFCVTPFFANLSEPGTANITAYVREIDAGQSCTELGTPATGATVYVTVTHPGGSADNDELSHTANGNYSKAFSLAANGTYTIYINATKTSYNEGISSGSIYVGKVITSFDSTSRSLYQDESATFSVTLNNFGEFLLDSVNTSLRFYDAGNGLVYDYLMNDSDAIAPQGSRTRQHTRYFQNMSAGTYTAKITADYVENGAGYSREDSFTFTVSARPGGGTGGPGGGGGGGGFFGAPAPPLKATQLEFTKYPVTKTALPGDSVPVELFVRNPLANAQAFSFEVYGIPAGWISQKTRTVQIGAGASEAIVYMINVPTNAETKDYTVYVNVSGQGVSGQSFFALSVKKYPGWFTQPAIMRDVTVNFKEKTTAVKLKIKNGPEYVQTLQIFEDVPKETARLEELVNFSETPIVVEEDPRLMWNLEKIYPYERRTVSYQINKVAQSYAATMYWAVDQANIIYEADSGIVKILNIFVPKVGSGGRANIRVSLYNGGLREISADLKLTMPLEWNAVFEKTVKLPPKGVTDVNLDAGVPNVPSGYYYADFSAKFGSEEVRRTLTVEVVPSGILGSLGLDKSWWLILIGFASLVLLAFARKRRGGMGRYVPARGDLGRDERLRTLWEVREIIKK